MILNLWHEWIKLKYLCGLNNVAKIYLSTDWTKTLFTVHRSQFTVHGKKCSGMAFNFEKLNVWKIDVEYGDDIHVMTRPN